MTGGDKLSLHRESLQQVYRLLYQRHGPQHWWPANSPFEVMVGAILVQNTNWQNVERAIACLEGEIRLSPQQVLEIGEEHLAELIRPAGYFRVKAGRLRNFCSYLLDAGDLDSLQELSTPDLRAGLLSVKGVGPETADDMLLYAFERPVFVVDAYTRRIFSRIGWIEGGEGYESLRLSVQRAMPAQVRMLNEFHALLVRHAKASCHKRIPACAACCIASICNKMKI